MEQDHNINNHFPDLLFQIQILQRNSNNLSKDMGRGVRRSRSKGRVNNPPAAEKVDLHSLNNRLIQVEAALAMITSGQFESVYPGVRELVENVRGMGGLAAGTGPTGSGGHAGGVGLHGGPAQTQGGRVEGYGQQQAQGPQSHSASLDTHSNHQTVRDGELHAFPHHQHTHQHHHHGSAQSHSYAASLSFKALARDCARVIDPDSPYRKQPTRSTTGNDSAGAQTQLIKLEPSPSDLGLDGSRSPSPIPFFAPTSQPSFTSNPTIPLPIYTSNPTTAPPILLPALSIYYPLPTIPPPGSSEPETNAPPFSTLSSGDGSSLPPHSTSNPSHPQITSALLALLPTGEKCLRWLELAENVVNVRGFPLEVDAPPSSRLQTDGHHESSKARTPWESFEERCYPLIGAQGKPRISEGEKRERTRHRERERRRERDRDKPPGSESTSPTADQQDRDLARERKEQEREKAKRARQIYFGGLATGPGGSVVHPGVPRRRAVDEYREREGLSPSPGSSGGQSSVEPRASSPRLFRPPGRRERVASISFHQALMSSPKREESLTFFALMCTVLAIGGIVERAETAKQAKPDESPSQPGPSASSTGILQSMDLSPSPEFLYALGRQALGVWDTHVSSSSSFCGASDREKQRLEYILTCCAAANYVLLGLELGIRPNRDGMFDGGDDSDSEGAVDALPGQVEAGDEGQEEERKHEESIRRKAGRIIYGLVGKMVNSGRAMGLANDPDLRSQSSTTTQASAKVKKESDSLSSNALAKFVRDDWKRAVWWEIVFWDLFVADVFSHQPYISSGSYTTRLPGLKSPSQNESKAVHSFNAAVEDHGHDQSGQERRTLAQRVGYNTPSTQYLVARYRLTALTQDLQAHLARPDCCCGYTLDQASSIEADVRSFLSQLPEPLKVATHIRKLDSDNLHPTKHHDSTEHLLKQMQAYELAIVANTLLLGVYAPFISSSSDAAQVPSTSARPPSSFGSTLLPPTGPGKSAMSVGSSLPLGLSNNGNLHASSHDSLTLEPTCNTISAASAKAALSVVQNGHSLGGHAGSGASANFAHDPTFQSADTNGMPGPQVDVNPLSGPGSGTSADPVTLGNAGSGMSRRGRELDVRDGNSSGVIDMPRLGGGSSRLDHGHVNALAIHASVRAAKSITRLFENLRDTILEIKSASNDTLVVPALFTLYPPPTTLLRTLLVLARAQGGFSCGHPDSWSGIADPKELLDDIEAGLSVMDRGNYWVNRLSRDDQKLLGRMRKKAVDIRSGTTLEVSIPLTAGIMARFNAEHEATEAIATAGIQHLTHGMKRKHSQVSVGPDAVDGSGARTFDHEFDLNDPNINSLPNTSVVTGSAGGRVGEVMMEIMAGSGPDPSFGFGSIERPQATHGAMLDHQSHSSPSVPQTNYINSDQLRPQGHSLSTFEQHEIVDDHPIAQQQHHSLRNEIGAPYHPYSHGRPKTPASQNNDYLGSHASRPQETLSDRLTAQRRDKLQEQLQRERDRRIAGGHEKDKERKSSSGSSSSRKSSYPTYGIRVRLDKDGQVITGSSHSSSSSGKNNETNPALITAYARRKMQDPGVYGQTQQQHDTGSLTGPSSPVEGFRSRSASLSQAHQAQMQAQYDQQRSAMSHQQQQQQDLASQQHLDFPSLSMQHGMPLSSSTGNFAMEGSQKKSYDQMHISERNTPAQAQQSAFGPPPTAFASQPFEQGMHGVFDSPQPTAQYDRSNDNQNASSALMSYHSNSSPFNNTDGAPSASGSPFQMNSSGHPTPSFPSHHPTPPVFGSTASSAAQSSTSHSSPVNFFHNQFPGHDSVSYTSSPALPTNLPHHHAQSSLHHQPQPLQPQRNALMDMQLERMEHNMMTSMPSTPVYEKPQLQPLNSFDNKTSAMLSEMHGMAQHSMSNQMDMSSGMGGGTGWGNRESTSSNMSVDHHHQQQQLELQHRHQQETASQNAFWNDNPDLKFFQ
ncbi:hypothetical protein CVT24_005428 [Panaeolus cyanescens]|uniref:Transcription factor domain-containing protein n=1 Tax=Panaeolus cyanescens TaxID=181874 RepID=A0A409VQP7_9AGAR|nr:hypothetical protein CVT24_005428 [Panaeolus cyanescens]